MGHFIELHYKTITIVLYFSSYESRSLHAVCVVWTHLTAGPRVKSDMIVVQEETS